MQKMVKLVTVATIASIGFVAEAAPIDDLMTIYSMSQDHVYSCSKYIYYGRSKDISKCKPVRNFDYDEKKHTLELSVGSHAPTLKMGVNRPKGLTVTYADNHLDLTPLT